ncbi:hypothetical protein Cni_G17415 [Canna indica]|uniref:Uncharacterized protein n=1 Tax=Canna indica TaxID=4628 RepID=A0AAQ3KIT5_9LILI|nr:hypothetical protein Cni_G17415 [Canna indica]
MLPSIVRRNSLLAYFQVPRLKFLFSSSTVADTAYAGGGPFPVPLSMVEYLVNSWGLSTAEASKASKSLAHLKSTEKPDAVLKFLRSQGFNGSHLKKIAPVRTTVLCCDVDKNLAPKFRSFRNAGFSEAELVEIVASNPKIINLAVPTIFSKLQVWERLFGSRDLLIKRLKRPNIFLSYSIEKRVNPNLEFLRDGCGISEERLSLVVRKNPNFIVRKLDSLHALVSRSDELGMDRKSKMFLWTLYCLHGLKKEGFDAKCKLMMRLGWSQSDLSTAVRKAPNIFRISKVELQKKMDFLVNEGGYTPSCVAKQPMLLFFNLEKRVIPRFRLIEALKSKGLWPAKRKLLSILKLPDKKLMEKFVLPFKEKSPELLDIL